MDLTDILIGQKTILAAPEEWLGEFITCAMARFPEIEQVYLLGSKARGRLGQKPDYSVLFYAGYARAVELMRALAHHEDQLRPRDGIVHLYVENYGATLCGLWGGSLIPGSEVESWEAGRDFLLLADRGNFPKHLAQRLHSPEERRQQERRQPSEQDTANHERRQQDRRQPACDF